VSCGVCFLVDVRVPHVIMSSDWWETLTGLILHFSINKPISFEKLFYFLFLNEIDLFIEKWRIGAS
jgi:hypothetical protein